MWPLVTYSNYFEIVSTVTFLYCKVDLFEVFNTVLLYLRIHNDYTRYNICSAWFLDIVTVTCYVYFLLIVMISLKAIYNA